MCIRDRGKFGEHLSVRGEGNDQQEHKDHQKYLGYGAVPVSYTHLDVYKRQILTVLSRELMPEVQLPGAPADRE